MTRLELSNGIYEGDLNEDNVPDGIGKFQYNSNSIKEYCGQWKDGRCHGQGRLSLVNGREYAGLFAYNQYIGNVNRIDENGHAIKVSTIEEYPEGIVCITRRNGKGSWDTYRGGWFNGFRHGYGELKYGSLKTSKEGFFFNDRYIAKNIVSMDTGKQIGLTNGQFRGNVVITYENGEIYEGGWNNGKRQGYGVYRYSNKDIYEGYWNDGKRSTNKALNQISTYHSYGTKTTYEGEFANDTYDGFGKLTKDDSADSYFGYFTNGFKNGKGTTSLTCIGEIEGEWAFGERIGTHKYTLKTSYKPDVIFYGEFKNNRMIGGKFCSDGHSIKCEISIDKSNSNQVSIDFQSIINDPDVGDLLFSIRNVLQDGIIVKVNADFLEHLLEKAKDCGSPKAISYLNSRNEVNQINKLGVGSISVPTIMHSCRESISQGDWSIRTTGCENPSYLNWD